MLKTPFLQQKKKKIIVKIENFVEKRLKAPMENTSNAWEQI